MTQGTSERAIRAWLRSRGVSVQADALGALAVKLASQLDADTTAPQTMAALARELRATVVEIGRLVEAPRESDAVDELRARRETRLGSG